jgi:large subunit ribosomal protein L10
LDRARKEQVVSELKNVFEHSGIIVAAKYAGITVAEMSDLRNKMRESSANVRVAKKQISTHRYRKVST